MTSNTTIHFRPFSLSLLWVYFGAALFLNPGTGISQSCVLVCPAMDPPVGIALDATCTDTLTLEDLGVFVTECAGPFTVDIVGNTDPLSNVITQDMIGQTFMVIVSSDTEGQQCMTAIVVQDKLPPQLVCPEDITVSCNTDLDSIPGIPVEDIMDCSAVTITKFDILDYSGECDSPFISKYTRTYVVMDEYSNVSTCTQMIFLEPHDIEDVVFPPDLKGVDALPCFPLPDTSPVNTGFPELGGFPIVNGLVCNISATYSDEYAALCSGGYKVFRTWVVTDWCNGNFTIDSVQIIEVADLTPPVVNAPDTIVVSAEAGCEADVLLPPADIFEDCSIDVAVRIQGSFGTIQSNGGLINDLAMGVHQVIYIATNDCNVEGRDTTIILVVDDVPPIPVCNASVVVPVGNTGMATVFANAFDSGSSDNCGPVFFKVRRMDAPAGFECYENGNILNQFDDVVKFCCEDIGNDNLMIILRVYDVEPIPGVVGESYLSGHFSDCMLQVTVQDKTAPQIECPSDLTISCVLDFDPENLSMFGTVATDPAEREDICFEDPGNPYTIGVTCVGTDGLATDNCSVSVSDSVIFDLESTCGTGVIRRIFTATDPGGLQQSCEQRITIINYTPFVYGDIIWPQDYTTSDVCQIDLLDPEDLPVPFAEPIVDDSECELVTFTHTDVVFDFSNSHQACFKILRTWTVLDWCQYQTGGSTGIWSRQQIIKVVNTTAPEIELAQQQLNLCTDDDACGPGNFSIDASATDDCSGEEALRWTISVDRFNNGSLDQIFPAVIGESVHLNTLLPIGNHRILYSVEDFCGNVTTEEQFVTMESCKSPTAVCRNLTTSLMPVDLDADGEADWGMVTLWAADLDASSYHVCGNDIQFAFSSNPTDVSKVFDCADLGENLVELWVIDNNGNTDFCFVTVTVQDNFDVCPENAGQHAIVTGTIATSLSEVVPGVDVKLIGSNLPAQATDANGHFAFPPMPHGGAYRVEPVLDVEHKKGVSTIDLILLQKHLLGIQQLSDPYTIIAADANHSETLSAMDIVVLRRLILGVTETIPGNTSWRFVDAAYEFGDTLNPLSETFSESYEIGLLSGDMDLDFVAIKVGDLNGSVMSALDKDGIEMRSAQTKFVMQIQDQYLQEGETALIEIRAKDLEDVEGMQFTLEWDNEIMDVIPLSGQSALMQEHWSLHALDAGRLPLAWTRYDAAVTGGTEVLITLSVTAKQKLSLGKTELRISNQVTTVEGLLVDGTFVEPVISILPMTSANDELLVYQNRPNPFTRKSIIPVVLPDAMQFGLDVYNAEGQLVHHADVQGQRGYNELFIDFRQLGTPGVYTYTISTATEFRTLRMIVVGE